MKMIKAYLRLIKAEEVYVALKKAGFGSMTLAKCIGSGRKIEQRKELFDASDDFLGLQKIITVEILAEDGHVAKIVGIIKAIGYTGYPGDGIIAISTIDEVHKIRTFEAESLKKDIH